MYGVTTPTELNRRLRDFFASAPTSTQELVSSYAHLNLDSVRVMPKTDIHVNNFTVAYENLNAEASFMSWPLWADKKLMSCPIRKCMKSINFNVKQDIMCFLIDTLTSAHLTVMTGISRHVSVSLTIEFLNPLKVEHPLILKSQILRIGNRICFLTAEVCQEQNGKIILCNRASHIKAFYSEKPETVNPKTHDKIPKMMSASLRPDAKPWAPRTPNVPTLQKINYPLPQHQQQQQQQLQLQQKNQPPIGVSTDPTSNVQMSPTAAKLFVGQLPFESDERRLYALFSAYGKVEHIHILRDLNNRSKGAAFVTYSNVEEADTAIFTLHNRHKLLANRMIQVSYAKNSSNISAFGAWNALAVHHLNPTNPVPDIANVASDHRLF